MGTGYPSLFRCAKCMVRANTSKGYRWTVTGRRRPLLASQRGKGDLCAVLYRAEYLCLDCGHFGWSRHRAIGVALERSEKEEVPF